jgi:hypothetical protein
MERFYKTFANAFAEAIEVSDDTFFDKGSKKQIENSTYEVEDILPNMSEDGKRYFELMIEGTYEELLKRIKKYTNTETPTRMALIHALMSSLNTITKIESSKIKQLEALAVSTILELDEFKLIRDLINEKQLKIVAKIKQPDLQKAMDEFYDRVEEDKKEAQEKSDSDITTGEEAELKAMDILLAPDASKAVLVNYITQGEAVNTWEIFKLLKDNIDAIDAKLLKLYELFCVGVHSMYFSTPFFNMNGALDSAAGMSQVEPEGDGVYTIKAVGINFPTLLHEVVKGCYDYIGLHAKDQETLDKEDINDEKLQLMAGPQIAKNFKNNILNIIGKNNIQYIQPLYAKLYSSPEVTADDIKHILRNTPQGKNIVKQFFDEVKEEQDSYENDQYYDNE